MKQVIVVNRALNLPPGKLAAQVAHASVSAFLLATPEARQDWLECGMPKIVLAAAGPEALQGLLARAQTRTLPASLVRDAGKTLLPEGTVTCLGIGPTDAGEIDPLTERMELF
ncbi:aminoacyl-tRNA hydrolase [Hoeflea sp. TYP-13]|uniref:aminoacyl-tRNA hydrolase n=1 Tax=Hoeflea sp. TYP-13 TaxID=3230023 RepID=UPI0034C5DB7D